MDKFFDSLRTWAEVDLDAIEHNFDAARKALPDNMKLLAVIKANAYGHGAVEIAKLLSEKADYFAVAATDEALELRKSGIETPILLLGHVPYADFELIVRHGITPAISDYSEAKAFSDEAVRQNKKAALHLAVDTGMSRIGFPATDEAVREILKVKELPNVTIEGVFSHLAAADTLDKTYTEMQAKVFETFTSKLKDAGIHIPLKHLYNSAAIADLSPRHDMAREGIILYGLRPSDEVCFCNMERVKPAMAFRTHVVQVKMLPPGIAISYGCTYVTKAETRVATVCAGYADGVPRLLSNKGSVLIHGKRAPIIGRICMDQFMVNVTELPQVQIGDTATIFGIDGDESISVDDIASSIGTIGYELVCNINRRVVRVYLKDGKVCGVARELPHE